ncbi:MAG: ABC transporter ATP-binding protein [Firmicutes bacterium]|nr:ABC transporter ATP-binding protein [Bacillota bacterium]
MTIGARARTKGGAPTLPLLELHALTKAFRGLVAVQDVNAVLESGEIVGLIGPNGAGKTTLFNLISGLHRPTQGRILLDGREITALPPYARSLLGIGRTFQIVRPFAMTVLENVMVPILARDGNPTRAKDAAQEILELVALDRAANERPENLTLAMRKRLEVARALATRPKLLLLDEVLAGLNPTEVEQQLPLIRVLRDKGITVLMIEHIVDAVMSVCDRVLVMDQGHLIADGSPGEVVRNPAVIQAYLGEEVPGA